MNDTNRKRIDKHAGYTTCGVWPIASRINHSCFTNCRRSFIGDMQIVRACQDMEADTELCFGYKPSPPHQTYKNTQKHLRSWGFVCGCVLCLDKKSTPHDVIQRRQTLTNRLKTVLKPGASLMQLTRAREILQDLEKTYTNGPLAPRSDLWDPYFVLGAELLARNKLTDGLEMLLRGLEDLGFSIVACPPRNVIEERNQARVAFEIKRWGQSNDYVPNTILRIMHAYEILAPELCEVAKEYACIAYSICYGEKETIGTLDSERCGA